MVLPSSHPIRERTVCKMFLEQDAIAGINCAVARIYGAQTAAVYNAVGTLGEEATADSVLKALPFLNMNQVKHSLRTLEKAGAIVSAQPFVSKMNRTKYYTPGEVLTNG